MKASVDNSVMMKNFEFYVLLVGNCGLLPTLTHEVSPFLISLQNKYLDILQCRKGNQQN
jgi:hypothetical protein